MATSVNNVQISGDLLPLIHGETREMYVGPRMSTIGEKNVGGRCK